MDFLRSTFSFATMRFLIPGFFGLTGVSCGAYAYHGLANVVAESAVVAFSSAVQYQMFHTLALLGVAALADGATVRPRQKVCLKAAFGFLTAGIIGFSFTVYARTLVGESMEWTRPFTPKGGLALMAGWALVMIAPLF